jgi:hypothetical protein
VGIAEHEDPFGGISRAIAAVDDPHSFGDLLSVASEPFCSDSGSNLAEQSDHRAGSKECHGAVCGLRTAAWSRPFLECYAFEWRSV